MKPFECHHTCEYCVAEGCDERINKPVPTVSTTQEFFGTEDKTSYSQSIKNKDMLTTKMRRFLEINEEMHKFIDKVLASDKFYNEEEKWSFIYDYVFSESCYSAAQKILDFDYYDPDATYEEDVKSFVCAFDHEVEKVRCVFL